MTDAEIELATLRARITSLESERAVNHTRLAANDVREAEQARRIEELEHALRWACDMVDESNNGNVTRRVVVETLRELANK